MAQTYTRQSSFADGDTITAALFNNEYNQLVNAFAYSSSSASSTGHRHDGTAGQGGNIHTIGDLDFLNKIVVDDTNNRWGVFVEVSSAAVEQIRIQDGAIVPVTDSDIDLGTTGVRFKNAYIDSVTTTGNVAVGGNLTVTGTTTFNGGTITMGDAATDNVVFGADVDSNIIPDDDDSYDLGSSSQQWRNLYIDGTANIDSLVADTADINGGTVDGAVIGGSSAAAITGTTITGTAITGTSFVIGSADISEAELETIDGVTAGTVAASKAIVVDSNKDFTGARNITLTGELDAGSLDVSGDVDVDGTLETDALSINGTAVTSTAAELNILDGVTSTAAELNILDGVTSTATELNLLDGVTSTTAELNILDGVTASAADINLIDGITNGTVIASKAIITDSNKDITGGRNITISGELDAATLDISGDADIDGTLEADAITIGGVTLAETISDTVGAMVSSNTETNITVTYEDSDNTLDFVIGTLNQDTTGLAGTATALATARTIHGVSFDGTANIDLSEVVQDTVGAMFSSNTESGITVDYQDGDGTIDLTVGTLNQNTTGSAATLTTARTIGGVSFDGSANITPTTFTTATFSGDVNIDSGLLFADVSTNRIGINQASPDVTLDLGANTDAVHVPVGTTAQRPASPAAGYFRYNSTTGDFEGYTDAWGAIAGSGGTAPAVDTMTGDGSDTTLTLTSAPVNENATVVTLDGVVQHKSTYSVSGNTLTFSTAPPSGVAVECITWTNTAINAALLMQDADGDTQIQVEESSDEDKIRFDTGGTERMVLDSNGLNITTADNSDNLTLTSTDADAGVGPNLNLYRNSSSPADSDVLGVITFNGRNDNSQDVIYARQLSYITDASDGTEDGTFKLQSMVAGTIRDRLNITPSEIVLNEDSVDTDFRVESGSNANMLFVDGGNNRVGIGTASPSTALHILGSSTSRNTIVSNVTIDGGTAVGYPYAGYGFGIDFKGVDYGNTAIREYGRIIAHMTNQTSQTEAGDAGFKSALSFYTNTGGASSTAATEKMTISAEGNVGIGTTSPSGKFHVAGHTGSVASIFESNGNGDTVPVQLKVKANNGTTSTQGLYGNAGSASTDNTITLGTSGTSGLTVTNGGNVGIGTTSPARNLHVHKASSGATSTSASVLVVEDDDNTELSILGGSSSVLAINFGHSGDNDEGKITFNTTAGSEDLQIVSSKLITLDASYVIVQGQSSYAQIALVGNDGVADGYVYAESGDVGFLDGDGNWAYKHDTDTSHQFLINNGEKMRINSSGQFLLGTTSNNSDSYKMIADLGGGAKGIDVRNVSYNADNGAFRSVPSGNTSYRFAVMLNSSNSTVGKIEVTSANTTYTTSSDYRLKENVIPLENGLDRLNQLKPVKFNWIESGQEEEGFIAHEVDEIFSDAVVGKKDAVKDDGTVSPQTMDYGRITPLLVKAIQEQQEQIEQLKTEIQTLKGE